MHVLVIAYLYPPDMGGGATRAQNIVKGLLSSKCKVTVLAAFPHYPYGRIPPKYMWKPLVSEKKGNVKIIRTFVPPVSSKGTLSRMLLFVSFIISATFALPLTGKVDSIFASNPNIVSIIPALAFKIFSKCPIIQNVDDLWPEDFLSFGLVKKDSFIYRVGSFLANLAYKLSTAITPISPGYVDVIKEKYNIPREKITVIRSGVDVGVFKERKNIRDMNKKKFLVLYTGAFSVAYDFDQILEAAKELQYVSDVEFLIQGGGELAGHIRTNIKELNLANIILMEKILSRYEVADLMLKADALILPLKNFRTPYLGISSKLYEYQAVGKPIICCAEGEPARYVEQTKSGVSVKPGDSRSLSKAILYLYESPSIARSLGKNGRIYVENNLTTVKIGMRIIGVIKKILVLN